MRTERTVVGKLLSLQYFFFISPHIRLEGQHYYTLYVIRTLWLFTLAN